MTVREGLNGLQENRENKKLKFNLENPLKIISCYLFGVVLTTIMVLILKHPANSSQKVIQLK